jgi:Icc-related predicted phosphoesterase
VGSTSSTTDSTVVGTPSDSNFTVGTVTPTDSNSTADVTPKSQIFTTPASALSSSTSAAKTLELSPSTHNPNSIRVVCMSDLHGRFSNLTAEKGFDIPGADILLIAGDLGFIGEAFCYHDLCAWVQEHVRGTPARKNLPVIMIPGNHDCSLDKEFFPRLKSIFNGYLNLDDVFLFCCKNREKLVEATNDSAFCRANGGEEHGFVTEDFSDVDQFLGEGEGSNIKNESLSPEGSPDSSPNSNCSPRAFESFGDRKLRDPVFRAEVESSRLWKKILKHAAWNPELMEIFKQNNITVVQDESVDIWLHADGRVTVGEVGEVHEGKTLGGDSVTEDFTVGEVSINQDSEAVQSNPNNDRNNTPNTAILGKLSLFGSGWQPGFLDWAFSLPCGLRSGKDTCEREISKFWEADGKQYPGVAVAKGSGRKYDRDDQTDGDTGSDNNQKSDSAADNANNVNTKNQSNAAAESSEQNQIQSPNTNSQNQIPNTPQNQIPNIDSRWQLIPDNCDILMTHSPALGYGDDIQVEGDAGCYWLLDHIQGRARPQLHVTGHIHQNYGVWSDGVRPQLHVTGHIHQNYGVWSDGVRRIMY